MKCPKCSAPNTVVLQSDPVVSDRKRRRECTACGHRFNTIETMALDRYQTPLPPKEPTP